MQRYCAASDVQWTEAYRGTQAFESTIIQYLLTEHCIFIGMLSRVYMTNRRERRRQQTNDRTLQRYASSVYQHYIA